MAMMFFAGCASSGTKGEGDSFFPVDPRIQRGSLKNGLRYMIRKNVTPPGKVMIWLHINTGSLDEKENQRGLAHFLEHLAFNGSKNFPPGKLVKYFESIGLTFGKHQNAFTGFDQTTYTITLPNNKLKTLDKGMLCMSDYAYGLSLLTKEINKERGVIFGEITARKSLRQRLMDKQLPVLLPGSRVAVRLPIGLKKVIKTADRKTFLGFYKKWYRPGNATLMVVGDMEPSKMKQLINKHFGKWKPASKKAVHASPEIKPYKKTRAAVFSDPELTKSEINLVHINPLKKILNLDDYLNQVRINIGNHIFNRRILNRIRQGKTSFLSAGLHRSPFLNVCTYSAAYCSGKTGDWKRMLKDLVVALKQARKFGFTDQEFSDAKKAILASAKRAVKTQSTVESGNIISSMNSVISTKQFPMSPEQRLRLIEKAFVSITVGEVSAVFKRNNQPEKQLILLEIPKKAGVVIPSNKALLKVALAAEKLPVSRLKITKRAKQILKTEPIHGVLSKSDLNKDYEVFSATFKNGVRFHHRYMKYKKDYVKVFINLGGGILLENKDTKGISSVAALAFSNPSTKRLSSTQIKDLLIGKNVVVFGGFSGDSLQLKIKGAPLHLRDGMRLVYQLLTQPKIEKAAFKQWKIKQLQKVAAFKVHLGMQLGNQYRKFISGNDVRLAQLTKYNINQLTINKAEKFLRKHLLHSPIEVSIVGDITKKKALNLALRYLGSLPNRSVKDETIKKLRILNYKKGPLKKLLKVPTITPKSFILQAWRGPTAYNLKAWHCLSLAAKIISIRLREDIREKRGLTYSVYCTASASWTYPQAGTLYSVFTADPSKAIVAAGIAKKIVNDFVKKGPSDNEIKVAKKQIINLIKNSRRSTSYWSHILSNFDYLGMSFSDIKKTIKRFKGYSKKDILKVIRKYIIPSRFIEVVVLPK